MSHFHVAIMDPPSELDDVRYAHHLKHRGQANHRIFWTLWISIAGSFALICAWRTYNWWRRRVFHTHRYARLQSSNRTEWVDLMKAPCNALAHFPCPRVFKYEITTMPMGRIVLLTACLATLTSLLTSVDASFRSQHYLDDVAFRAAWVTTTQIPLVYLLSTKRGPINFIVGLSHEHINWSHRWIGRMLFLSATVHVVIMKSSISTKDILHSQERGMSVVRYGIGAYATLIWIVITSIVPLRRWSYRAFFINHYISTLALLGIAFQHVPTYARPSIYIAISILALDKVLVAYFFIQYNVSMRPPLRRFAKFRRGLGRGLLVTGYPVKMTTPSMAISSLPAQTIDSTTIIRITNIPFTWTPGQHIRLYVPALGRWEMHPFTPANCSVLQPPPFPPRKDTETGALRGQPIQTSDMLLMIKFKSGFTRRLANYHKQWLARPCPNTTQPANETLTAYIDGPYGNTLRCESYGNLILIASSTGVSFILSILDHLEQLCFLDESTLQTRHIKIIWVIRHIDPNFQQTITEIVQRCVTTFQDAGIQLDVEFCTTCPDSAIKEDMIQHDPFAHLRPALRRQLSDRPVLRIRHPNDIYDEWDREAEMGKDEDRDPCVGWDEYASPDEDMSESENSTLVDGQEGNSEDGVTWMREVEDGSYSDSWALGRDEEGNRPLPAPRQLPRGRIDAVDSGAMGCQCALVQHQRQKMNARNVNMSNITQTNGVRPNIRDMLGIVTGEEKTMVAVCANAEIVRDVRGMLAEMNMEYACGRRKKTVQVWIENQS